MPLDPVSILYMRRNTELEQQREFVGPAAFHRRQVLARGSLVHATDGFQTRCLGRVLPGATDVPADTAPTCPECEREQYLAIPFSRHRIPPVYVAAYITVQALDAPWAEEELSHLPITATAAAREWHVQYRCRQAAQTAVRDGLQLGPRAQEALLSSGLLPLLQDLTRPAIG
ncbi:hypothetical protein [Streptomyces sp. SPB4]|uniref:hypothetical protein n=1 Tax=Streptomyces sp. SPB4 TaxID=2940553 RepID=UPI002473753D|nr:hypothetical protein [Streptomyces sp. SPB4]